MYNWEFEKWSEFVYNEKIISNNALKFAELSDFSITGNRMPSGMQSSVE